MSEINNQITSSIPHAHPADEMPYSDIELRDHMVKYHGWTLGMIKQRGWTDNGDYIRAFHNSAHQTAHLDNPTGR